MTNDLVNEVCSHELAMKLKLLGVNQDSIYSWQISPFNNELHVNLTFAVEESDEQACSAFTCAELGRMIPREKYLQTATECGNHLQITKNIDGCFIAGYVNHDNGQLWPISVSLNEANVRAGLLIYLLENRLMELPK